MITINDQTHDRVLKLINKLELKVADLVDRGYNRNLPKLGKEIARLEGAQDIFDIINGNN